MSYTALTTVVTHRKIYIGLYSFKWEFFHARKHLLCFSYCCHVLLQLLANFKNVPKLQYIADRGSTRLVSPQFNVKLDSNFQTVREKGARTPPSTWQIKCSFIQQPTKASQHDPVPKTRRMTRDLPMQQPEGAQPTNNDESQPVPEAEPNQDPEPQELPPLQRSRHLHQPVN